MCTCAHCSRSPVYQAENVHIGVCTFGAHFKMCTFLKPIFRKNKHHLETKIKSKI